MYDWKSLPTLLGLSVSQIYYKKYTITCKTSTEQFIKWKRVLELHEVKVQTSYVVIKCISVDMYADNLEIKCNDQIWIPSLIFLPHTIQV